MLSIPKTMDYFRSKWNIYQSNLKQKHKDEKRHYCKLCDVACKSPYDLRKHFYTQKHECEMKGFTKGGISEDKTNNGIRFRWKENGKKMSKSWYYGKKEIRKKQ